MGIEGILWTSMPQEKFSDMECPHCEHEAELTYTGDFKDTFYYACSNCKSLKVAGSAIIMHNRTLKERVYRKS